MTKTGLSIVLLFITIFSFSQQITHGPEIGEIYFMGPTSTVLYDAIYRSTDFGETAICMDSISALSYSIESIAADKTPGGLYFVTMLEQLFYSDNYGQYGSWLFRNSDIYVDLLSGRNEGEIFNSIVSHSNDYGSNFINHSFNGFFGSLIDVEIDFSDNIGYCIAKNFNVADTQYLFKSIDNYENLEVVNKFNFAVNDITELSRGNQEGEIFIINRNTNNLYFSCDNGENWDVKNSFTCPNLPIEGITGGRQDGELYMLVVYRQSMGYIRHVYIYHSLDYGETFTVYHPVSIGSGPVYANFEASDTLGEPPFEVQFTDLSNSPMAWEWDFDNDGEIDSYEQNPTYSYEDTGYYTVKLEISWYAVEDFAVRHDYIHVTDLTNVIETELKSNYQLLCYPNPFKEKVTILQSLPNNTDPGNILIYDIYGEFINILKLEKNGIINEHMTSWDGLDKNGNKVKPGIYYALTEDKKYSQKIVLTN